MARKSLKMRKPKNRSKFPKTIKSLFESGGTYSTEKQRKKVPANYFLDPKNRKYPWKDPVTGKPSVYLLTAAYRRAKQYHKASIAAKAKRLLKRYFGIEVG